MPRGDVAVALVAEAHRAGVGHHGEGPVAFHRFAELRLQRHQREEALHRGVAKHLMMFRQVPESIFSFAAVVVDDSPAQSYLLVLIEFALHRLLRAFGTGEVEGRDVELHAQPSALAVAELVVVGVVGVGQIFQPLLRAPHHRPRLALGGGRHDVVVLRMDVLEFKERFHPRLHVGVQPELVGVWPS